MNSDVSIGELKKRAKNSLSKSLGAGYLLHLTTDIVFSMVKSFLSLVFVFSGLGILFTTIMSFINVDDLNALNPEDIYNILRIYFRQLNLTIVVQYVYYILLAIATILFLNHLKTGLNLWFSRNREGPMTPPFSFLFYQFTDGRYFSTLKGMAWRDFWLFLWRLPIHIGQIILFLVIFFKSNQVFMFIKHHPGPYNFGNKPFMGLYDIFAPTIIFALWFCVLCLILGLVALVKKYSYRATEWILADNPHLDHRRALNLSKQMMKGNKGRWFLLRLSFIGWHLLLAVLFLFSFFLKPLLETYIRASEAELYADIRDRALKQNMVSLEELGFVVEDKQKQQTFQSAREFYNQFGDPSNPYTK